MGNRHPQRRPGVTVRRVQGIWYCKGLGGIGTGHTRVAAMVNYAQRMAAGTGGCQ